MKKITYFIMLQAVFLCSGLTSYSQYIKLSGNQFVDENGQAFFPMVMNYYVDFAYSGSAPNSNLDNVFKNRASQYGLDGQFTGVIYEGDSKILQDLYEIKNLGFNTVRLIMKPEKKSTGVGLSIPVENFPYGQNHMYLNIDPDPNTHLYVPTTSPKNNLQFFFENLVSVINMANSVGLKVICPTIGDSKEMISWDVSSPNQLDNRAYFTALATYINSQQIRNILAFEFIGEPTYQVKTEFPGTLHSKPEICEIVKSWVTSIKSVNTNYMTTIGVVNIDDPQEYGWDPFLLNVDFVNVHFYPNLDLYEYQSISPPLTTSQFRKRYIDRYNNLLYVYDNFMKKPYIIGETCFMGENPPSNIPNMVYPIAVLGNESDQNLFVQQTFPIVLGSNAAGYGWWQFQNVHYYPDPVSPYYPEYLYSFDQFAGDHEGLLRSQDPVLGNLYTGYSGSRKSAANTFISYFSNPPSPSYDFGPATPVFNKDDDYYNPYRVNEPSNPYYDVGDKRYLREVIGHVYDENGRPIQGAIVKACCITGKKIVVKERYSNGAPKVTETVADVFGNYTFTDVDGKFEIYGRDNKPGNEYLQKGHEDINRDETIENIKIYAYGSNSIEVSLWTGDVIQHEANYTLKSLQFEFERTYSNINVGLGTTRNLHAYSILNVNGMTINGTSEISARDLIVLGPTFRAFSGSNTRIFNNNDCNDIYSLENTDTPLVKTKSLSENEIHNEIEKDFFIDIYPNPFSVSATIEYNLLKAGWVNISLYDMMGDKKATLLNDFKESGMNTIQLDKAELSPGLYFISINSIEGLKTKKVMILQ